MGYVNILIHSLYIHLSTTTRPFQSVRFLFSCHPGFFWVGCSLTYVRESPDQYHDQPKVRSCQES